MTPTNVPQPRPLELAPILLEIEAVAAELDQRAESMSHGQLCTPWATGYSDGLRRGYERSASLVREAARRIFDGAIGTTAPSAGGTVARPGLITPGTAGSTPAPAIKVQP